MNWWIDEYKKYHAELNTNYPGNNLKPQLHHIVDLVKDTKAKTLLYFGCGRDCNIPNIITMKNLV